MGMHPHIDEHVSTATHRQSAQQPHHTTAAGIPLADVRAAVVSGRIDASPRIAASPPGCGQAARSPDSSRTAAVELPARQGMQSGQISGRADSMNRPK
jgi:hypothetical protein